MAERGTLLLVNSSGMVLSSGDMDQMLIDQKNGFSSQSFQAYKHLKSLGYIVGHHDVQWTMKNEMQHGSTLTGVGESTDSSGISISALEEGFSVTDGLGDMHINHEAKPTFDVYYPNSKFTTSSPGEPDFVVYLAREGSPPSKAEIEILETRCKGVALMVCLVDLGRVCLFSYAKIELDLSSDMSDLVSEFPPPPPPSSLMEVNDWEVSSNGTQDSEIDLLQDSDEDELLSMSGSIPRFQPRKVQSKARWDEEMRMAEVLEKKGRCWATTGISRNSKTYLSIEEAMFMAERGALVLVNNNDVVLSIGDMYWMLSALGVSGVGGSMAVYGVFDAISSLVSGTITSGLSSITLITSSGAFVQLVVLLWILLGYSATTGARGYVYPLLMAAMLGVGDGRCICSTQGMAERINCSCILLVSSHHIAGNDNHYDSCSCPRGGLFSLSHSAFRESFFTISIFVLASCFHNDSMSAKKVIVMYVFKKNLFSFSALVLWVHEQD